MHVCNFKFVAAVGPKDDEEPLKSYYRCSCGASGVFSEERSPAYWESVDEILNDLGIGKWERGKKVGDEPELGGG